ncbi:MAG TPA: GNAT family N-acetyltransferase, partial [Tianweitania sediminis]|nr:GNAT family N-acetyltransferase [Tianweitania sediminis]
MGFHLPFFFVLWRDCTMVAEQEDLEHESRLIIDCPVLITDRLVMRPPHEADIPDLVRYANDRQLAAMLSSMPHPYRETEARNFIARWSPGSNGVGYALTRAEDAGFVGCASISPGAQGAELGYWIGRPFWGQGYATEAAHALVGLMFRATQEDVLHASCR